jgi:hypothetical protein
VGIEPTLTISRIQPTCSNILRSGVGQTITNFEAEDRVIETQPFTVHTLSRR